MHAGPQGHPQQTTGVRSQRKDQCIERNPSRVFCIVHHPAVKSGHVEQQIIPVYFFHDEAEPAGAQQVEELVGVKLVSQEEDPIEAQELRIKEQPRED